MGRVSSNHRVPNLPLSDSIVVIGALSKGIFSSDGLPLYFRRVCDILIAHEVSVNICYVLTECNPADEPSRGRPFEQGPSPAASIAL